MAHMASAQLAPSMLMSIQTITPPCTEGTWVHWLCQCRGTIGITNRKWKSPETTGSLPSPCIKTSESRHHCIQPAQWYSLCSEPLKGNWTMMGEWTCHSSLQLKSDIEMNTAEPRSDPQFHFPWFPAANHGPKILNGKFQTWAMHNFYMTFIIVYWYNCSILLAVIIIDLH